MPSGKGHREVSQSCPTLCDPMDCSLWGSSIHGIFQARVLECVAISFSRGSSQPREWTWVSCIAGRHFTIWATKDIVSSRQICKDREKEIKPRPNQGARGSLDTARWVRFLGGEQGRGQWTGEQKISSISGCAAAMCSLTESFGLCGHQFLYSSQKGLTLVILKAPPRVSTVRRERSPLYELGLYLVLGEISFLLLFSCSVGSNSLPPHGLQHARLPYPSLSPGVCSHSGPLSQWSYRPSHPLPPSSPFAFNLSQHEGLFQWVNSSHQVAKGLELQLQSFQWIFMVDFFYDWWFDLLAVQGTLKNLLQHHSSKASILWHLAFFMVQLSHPYVATGKP